MQKMNNNFPNMNTRVLHILLSIAMTTSKTPGQYSKLLIDVIILSTSIVSAGQGNIKHYCGVAGTIVDVTG